MDLKTLSVVIEGVFSMFQQLAIKLLQLNTGQFSTKLTIIYFS